MASFNESSNSDLRIRYDGQDDTYVHVQPAIDVDTEIETADGTRIRPRPSLGITQFIGNAVPEVSGRFAAAPATVASFTASTELDKTRVDVAAGVDVLARKSVLVRAEVFGSFSKTPESCGGGLRLQMSF